jgi:hypothetical protein
VRRSTVGPAPLRRTATIPVPPTPVVTSYPKCFDTLGEFSGCLLLMHGKLGSAMQIEIERLHLRIDSVHLFSRWSCPNPGLSLRGGVCG